MGCVTPKPTVSQDLWAYMLHFRRIGSDFGQSGLQTRRPEAKVTGLCRQCLSQSLNTCSSFLKRTAEGTLIFFIGGPQAAGFDA